MQFVVEKIKVKPSCSTCAFRHVCADGISKCHKKPPVVVVANGSIVSVFPSATTWCGEYERAEGG